MKETRGNRLHIGFFGKRNVGKSSLVNKIANQSISIVSNVAGTTTDVNQKSMELLPIGPVVLMDTAGIDDNGYLGEKRILKTKEAIKRTDVAVVVYDNTGIRDADKDFLLSLKNFDLKILSVINKVDIGEIPKEDFDFINKNSNAVLKLSAISKEDIADVFKKTLLSILPSEYTKEPSLLCDIVNPGDTVALVIPIDKEAPKGRIILPQVNVLRNLLDNNSISVVCTEAQLQLALESLKNPPKLVVTDSQAFKKVSEIVPENILLTSFSIIFARLKGDLKTFANNSQKIDDLKEDDKVLILESCTHHPVEDDIGRVKIPELLRKYTGKKIIFEHYSGHDFPSDISQYSLIIHCGACMTNRKEILNRIKAAQCQNIPITNYGIAIAKCHGILDRAIEPFI